MKQGAYLHVVAVTDQGLAVGEEGEAVTAREHCQWAHRVETRGEPGHAGDYHPGVAGLYRDLELSTHPVATNSGVHWPAHGFLRRPGVIVFEYLEPIPPGLKRGEFMRRLEHDIETASNALLSL